MRTPRTFAVAASAVVLLAVTACDSDTGTINGGEDNGGTDEPGGLPASTMKDWDGACDHLLDDEIFDHFGFEEYYGSSPIDQNYGEGSHQEALNCEAMADWPTVDSPTGQQELKSDGNFGLFLYPADSVDEAQARFDDELRRYDRDFGSWDHFLDDEIEGPWNEGRLFGNISTSFDAIYWFVRTDDFVFQGHITYSTDDPGLSRLEHLVEIGALEEADHDPDEWQYYEFDRESAQTLLVEEFLPSLNQSLLDRLER